MLQQIEQQLTDLQARSLQLYKAHEYDPAIEVAETAVALARQHLGDAHLLLATSLETLATVHLSDSTYDTAWTLFQDAIAVRQRALGPQHPDLAAALDKLASLHEVAGDYPGAVPLYQAALDIRRVILGEAHPLFASSLNNLAGLLQTIGDYPAAEQLYTQALAVLRQNVEATHPTVATALNNLASLYSVLGQYAAAEPLYQEALAIRRATDDADQSHVARTLNNLAYLYESLGRYAAAEPLYQEALAIRRRTVGEHDPAFARVLSNLAGFYEGIGNYAAAVPLYRQVLEIDGRAFGEHHQTYATDLNNLAALYHAMAHYREAEALYQQALAIDRAVLGETHINYAMDLSNLAALYEAMGDYAVALPLAQQAETALRRAVGDQHPHMSALLTNQALLHQRLGGYTQAADLLQQAFAIQQTTLGHSHPLIAKTLNSLGFLAYETGDYVQAERYYRRALQMQQKVLGTEHADVSASLSNLASLYTATSQLPRALALARHAAQIDNWRIEQVFAIGSEDQRMEYLASLRRDFCIFLSLIVRCGDQSPRARQLGLQLVLRRKGLGAEALAAQRDALLGGRYPALAASLTTLTNLRMQIARRLLNGPGTEGLATHERLLTEWHKEKDLLESELARQIPEIRLQRHFRDISPNSVAAAIPPNTTLIEFVRYSRFDFAAVPSSGEESWTGGHYLAFVLNSGQSDHAQLVDLGKADPIDDLITKLRACITHGTGSVATRTVRDAPQTASTVRDATFAQLGTDLRKFVFDPLIQTQSLHTTLLLAPDGALTSLPFEVLPFEGEHLIDRYQISYLSAGRDVLRLQTVLPNLPAAPLIMADPDFDLKAPRPPEKDSETLDIHPDNTSAILGGLARLQATAEEGRQVGALFGVQPVLGAGVLKTTIMGCRSPRILHIATHGLFLPETIADHAMVAQEDSPGEADTRTRLSELSHLANPLLRSFLALAGINTWLQRETLLPAAENGILTAEDVTGLDLLSTELVVLSACDTGLGDITLGEGVYGLRRAFMLAGARTLVMTLWKVPDQETRELMVDFYRRILAGGGRAVALRAAQLALKARNPDPLYWGAFICQGESQPLQKRNLP